jgi:hypothetical protein
MTLKLKLMGAVLGAALIGAAGQAKADVLRVNVGPARVAHVQPTWRGGWAGHRRYERPAVSYRPVVAVPVASQWRGYPVADAQDPSQVAVQIRAETDRAADDLRFDVRQRAVEPRALASLEADRQEIERDLAEASAKGYITADDRAHLEAHVQEIRDLRTQFACANQGQVTYWR